MDLSHILFSNLTEALKWFGLSLVIFTLLGMVFTACNPERKRFHKDLASDALYWIVMPFFYGRAQLLVIALAATLLFQTSPDIITHRLLNGYGIFGTLPLFVQCILILLFSDILQYWLHRMFHEGRWWKYHAIHHSPMEVNWWTAARFHPVNYLLSFTSTASLMVLVGFSPLAFVALLPFNVLYSGMVHANLNWTFGPLRYVFASPVFHRWHHTAQAEGLDKNFAPTFPFLDVMFGTFYMPEGKLPHTYGIDGGDVPTGFIGQMLYPFKRRT